MSDHRPHGEFDWENLPMAELRAVRETYAQLLRRQRSPKRRRMAKQELRTIDNEIARRAKEKP